MPDTTEKTGNVAHIDYRTGFLFEVKLDGVAGTFIADNTMNQTAVDIAMMRGAKVTLEVDQNGLIRRVQSDVPPDPPRRARAQTVKLTRISTQVNGMTGKIFCEVFFMDGSTEKSVQSFDPVIERLAGSACVARRPVRLVLDPLNDLLLLGISKSEEA